MNCTLITKENNHFFASFCAQSGHPAANLAFGLMIDDVACGVAEFFVEGHHAQLTHLFVAPSHRRQGGASYLLHICALHLRQCNISTVTAFPAFSPWDRDCYWSKFLLHCGFREFPAKSVIYQTNLNALIAQIQRDGVTLQHQRLITLAEVPDTVGKKLASTLPHGAVKENFLALITSPNLVPTCSIILMEDKRLVGYLLVHQPQVEELELVALHHSGTRPLSLHAMMRHGANCARGLYPSNTTLTMHLTNEKMLHFLETLAPNLSYRKTTVHTYIKDLIGGALWVQ